MLEILLMKMAFEKKAPPLGDARDGAREITVQ